VLHGSKLVIFGGKGGVGKSVIAAASGLHMAQSRPDLKVLIFSADPAHSLSDVFGFTIGDKLTAIEGLGNLDAIEIDGAALLEDLKLELKNDIEAAFDRFLGQGMDMAFDREIFQELFTMTPPGLDELMALNKILDLSNTGVYDLIILDSPASGHLVRLLELPHLVREWLNQAFHILIKYKGLGSGRFHDASARLVKLSREIREIIKTLNDPGSTEFVMITIPEAMAVAEAEHLAASLESLRIPSSNIVVNMVVPPVECPFCSRREEEQQKYMARIHTIFAGRNIVSVPLFTRPVNNREALDTLAQSLYRSNKQGVCSAPVGKC
ncbi:MAG: ArsA family ATPase, partial [Chloroflexi bacterium]|nr:ArsA family ATPase [Chloroflexota bacterium]